ncbi:7-carboxy-7-deazaguanine synthase QueE [Bacillus alkalicellulosilyticus]|uniref:7-carboxy-7-deazaguanine synthase QueE n=1 Tax=Alkalihalobacterium alkalicellulosilyticum TaxID=1912214 RepID=UPI00099817B2|nr:radical SAM protein [Bacillus alkalicellulosilyticus]
MSSWDISNKEEYLQWELPMVEIFETVEGEGSAAGYPTVFVRVFHCNLRCTWCDTSYSYAPAKPEFHATIEQIIERVKQYKSKRICFTGGEPLIHGKKSAALLMALTELEHISDIHVETNGAINLQPFEEIRQKDNGWQDKVRFILDYKLPGSAEEQKMIMDNFIYLYDGDEIKFVIADDVDFERAVEVVETFVQKGQVLFSPVWETMPPEKLVQKVIALGLADVKVSLQLHKIIWDPDKRGV